MNILTSAKLTTPKLWAEEGIAKTMRVASVIPKTVIDKAYSFAIPDELRQAVTPGQRVSVPIGRRDRLVDGFVLEISERPWDNTLKFIDSLLEKRSWLSPDLLALGQWIARYYAAPLGRVLSAMVPAVVRKQSGYERVRRVWLKESREDIERSARRIGPQQKKLLEALPENGETVRADSICQQVQVSTATLRQAIKKGWVGEKIEKQPRSAPNFDQPIVQPSFSLNHEQQRACEQIGRCVDDQEFKVLLLYGVSGSGKTEVYIDAMRRAVSAGKQVIVLVPEIALTTQLVHRFASRFKDVAVIHSGLPGTQRSLLWNAIRTGEKRVIIGTRSAIFAPCKNLGLIVVDEEQEHSYKNQQVPRFHARDVAIKRAHLAKIPVLLGSATPALETWHNCDVLDHYTAIRLTRRVAGLDMPKVDIVDMRYEEKSRPGFHMLSRLLERRLADTLADGGQAVLFLNRRGYAQVLYCPQCKSRVLCKNCKASMVFHRSSGHVACHHCYHRQLAPKICADPSCAAGLVRFGLGTEKVEEEIARKFPSARLRRIDSDTMAALKDYEDAVGAFERREFDIMIGTQMVAKGLDFPFVSLVGVINADTALYMPDFRTNERTFQLVTQVAGRAGRAQAGGRAVIQTLMSDLPALIAAAQHDYDSFAKQELQTRRRTAMPPFSRLTRWVLSDKFESTAKQAAAEFAAGLRDACKCVGLSATEVTGPLPCPLERLRNQYRFDVLLRTATAEDRMRLFDYLRHEVKLRPRVQRMIIDVDPVSLM